MEKSGLCRPAGVLAMMIRTIIILIVCAAGGYAVRSLRMEAHVRPLSWLLFVLPFMSGGFYTGACAAVTVFLLGYLLWTVRRNQKFTLCLSDPLAAVALLALDYSVSFLWAADHGMAAWGVVRFVPVLLFALALLQLKPGEISDLYRLVPLSAAAMTVLAGVIQYIPALADQVTVNGRLAGFFEYPNTYAAFLEVALVICAMDPNRDKRSVWVDAVLVFGVFASGSRTGFILLAGLLILLCIQKKDKVYTVSAALIFGACLAFSLLASHLEWNTASDRYLTISAQSSTMLGRFLYFADALKMIAKHPFGLGYLGYRAVQGGWQSGVYDVTYVHNWLLQLLLDVGWVPALVFLAAVVRSFFAKTAGKRDRLIMLVILGHGMMDFDLEYLSIWLLLLPALALWADKPIAIRRGGKVAMTAGAAVGLLCVWLAAGELLYHAGQVDLCLKVTPFHTQAQEYRLTQIQDALELDEAADRVLALKPSSSIAHSAKANAAFAAGDIQTMMDEKEEAITWAQYRVEEYCDYFDKLYEAMNWYLEAGDAQSAAVCAEKLRNIPQMLSALADTTSPLAWKIADQPQLELPEEYRQLLAQIAG